MADILDFRRSAGRSSRRPSGTSAEIVLFPGVRYERWETAPSQAAAEKPKRGRRTKRDTLDLES
jgi:hypothetical protein